MAGKNLAHEYSQWIIRRKLQLKRNNKPWHWLAARKRRTCFRSKRKNKHAHSCAMKDPILRQSLPFAWTNRCTWPSQTAASNPPIDNINAAETMGKWSSRSCSKIWGVHLVCMPRTTKWAKNLSEKFLRAIWGTPSKKATSWGVPTHLAGFADFQTVHQCFKICLQAKAILPLCASLKNTEGYPTHNIDTYFHTSLLADESLQLELHRLECAKSIECYWSRIDKM